MAKWKPIQQQKREKNLAWTLKYSAKAIKELKKIDKTSALKIVDFLDDLTLLDNPREKGKALKGTKKQFWRYRIGTYRVLCNIEDNELIIIATHLGHRKNVYSSN